MTASKYPDPAIDRVRLICRFAKPGDQIPLPWDIWEAYAKAIENECLVIDEGGAHPLRLPVQMKDYHERKQQIILSAPSTVDRSKFAVCVFPVIK